MKWIKTALIIIAAVSLVGYGGLRVYGLGYSRGEEAGYDSGFSEGQADGYESGEEVGYEQGQADGYGAGRLEGYYEGEAEGYSSGKEDGYDEGYLAAEIKEINHPDSFQVRIEADWWYGEMIQRGAEIHKRLF